MKLDLPVMHGCQNRFAIVDEDVSPIEDPRKSALVLVVAARLDIHGVLFLSAHGGPRMRIFDRDGTEATMCGNGIRCAARHFRDHGCVTGSHFTIGTLDGPKPVFLENRWVTVDMGRVRGYRRLAEDRHFAFTGIPHLVILTGGISVDTARAEGRRLRYDRALGAGLGHPGGLHVNFVQVSGDGSLDVLTYEAGVEDVTPACGTGSTAAAYVCARIGQTSFPVRVRLLGGELVIDARRDSMTMRGPAEYMRPFALDVSHLRDVGDCGPAITAEEEARTNMRKNARTTPRSRGQIVEWRAGRPSLSGVVLPRPTRSGNPSRPQCSGVSALAHPMR